MRKPLKKFSFRLEPLLKYRSDREERAVMNQARTQKEYQDRLDVLENINIKLKNAWEAGLERATADECLARSLYIDYLAASRDRQEKAVESTLGELEERRRAVVEARKDKLVLEKLKEKLYLKNMDEHNRWEIKTIDDQCTAINHRSRGGDLWPGSEGITHEN